MLPNRTSRRAALGLVAGLSGLLVTALAAPATAAGRHPLDGRHTLGDPGVYRNLTLFPVYGPSGRSAVSYLTLDEALRSKQVRVREKPGGGTVNTLLVSNTSNRPLYLMAGEVVLGGQQDRCVGQDLLIPPKKRDAEVPVFCVEHGRWAGKAEFSGTAVAAAAPAIRASAQEGVFTERAGRPTAPALGTTQQRYSAQANLAQTQQRVQTAEEFRREVAARTPAQSPASGGRAEVQSRVRNTLNPAAGRGGVAENQSRVWDLVAQKNARFGASPASGTYRDVLNLEGGDSGKSVRPYVSALEKLFGRDPNGVGVIAVVNGKVVAADLFGDSALFQKLWPKLLRSYAAEAAENQPTPGQKTGTVTPAQAREFVLAARAGKRETGNRSGVATTERLEAKETVVYRFLPGKPATGRAPVAAAGGSARGAMPGGGAPIHENLLRK